MSQQDDRRVLSRLGARELTREECDLVAGSIQTGRCTIAQCNQDGDCPVPIGCPPPAFARR